MNFGELDWALPALCVPSGPRGTSLQPLTRAHTEPVPTGAPAVRRAAPKTPKSLPGPQCKAAGPQAACRRCRGPGSPASWYSW